MVLEKAYAKFYGSYSNIVAGKVHFALADLTGGSPEEIRLDKVQNNPNAFWTNLKKLYEQKHLLGAGSPENPSGDAAVSREGIVQGHAYSIMKVEEVDDNKLIKLRNPHGSKGVEWQGDWSDSSSTWNKRLIAKLNVEDKADGEFWMCLDDFLQEFKSLYICRVFDHQIWNELEIMQGAWRGQTACGLPNKENPQIDMTQNPQYQLNITKDATVFIELIQKNCQDLFKGPCFVTFIVVHGNERAEKFIKDDLVYNFGNPTNLKIVSGEIEVSSGQYIIFCCQSKAGNEGEFTLRIHTSDTAASIKEV